MANTEPELDAYGLPPMVKDPSFPPSGLYIPLPSYVKPPRPRPDRVETDRDE